MNYCFTGPELVKRKKIAMKPIKCIKENIFFQILHQYRFYKHSQIILSTSFYYLKRERTQLAKNLTLVLGDCLHNLHDIVSAENKKIMTL